MISRIALFVAFLAVTILPLSEANAAWNKRCDDDSTRCTISWSGQGAPDKPLIMIVIDHTYLQKAIKVGLDVQSDCYVRIGTGRPYHLTAVYGTAGRICMLIGPSAESLVWDLAMSDENAYIDYSSEEGSATGAHGAGMIPEPVELKALLQAEFGYRQ